MINRKAYLRMWQSRISPNSIPLDIRKIAKKTLDKLFHQYGIIADNYNLKNKTVIDYGCGGGLLGSFLHYENIEVKKYIGLDIVPRCIKESKLNNVKWDTDGKAEFHLVEPFIMCDLKEYKSYIIIVLNVIPYLPTMKYIKMFFDELNNSDAKNIFIHFRKGGDVFRDRPYKTTHDVGQANYLKLETVTGMMDKYIPNRIMNKYENCYICFKKIIKRKVKEDDINLSD